MATRPTERGLDRLVNFSDATVAIAITLLILPLVDFAPEAAKHPVGQVLSDHWSTILSFFITFVLIGRLWMVHHSIFESVTGYTRAFVWVNMVWLLSIILLPFAAALLASVVGTSAPIDGIYIGTITLSSAMMFVMEWMIDRMPVLRGDGDPGTFSLIDGIVPTAMLLIAGILAVTIPSIGLLWLLLLLLEGPIQAILKRMLIRPQT